MGVAGPGAAEEDELATLRQAVRDTSDRPIVVGVLGGNRAPKG